MPAQGERYKAVETIGSQFPLYAGTTVTVREVVAADVQGAHDAFSDAVVVDWTEPAVVYGEKGVEIAQGNRAISVAAADFERLFQPVEGDG
jgi:hypothetical protein